MQLLLLFVIELVYMKKHCYICKKIIDMDKHYNSSLPGENVICELFNEFPELNIRQVARAMGVNETLMQNYVSGVKKPAAERREQIEKYLHDLGRRLLAVDIK